MFDDLDDMPDDPAVEEDPQVAEARLLGEDLNSSDSRVRWDACLALAKLGPAAEAHIPALERLSAPKNEPESDVRRAAKKAIKEITTPVVRVVREVKELPPVPVEEVPIEEIGVGGSDDAVYEVDREVAERERLEAEAYARAQRAAYYAAGAPAATAGPAASASAAQLSSGRPEVYAPSVPEGEYPSTADRGSSSVHGNRASRKAPSWQARMVSYSEAPPPPRVKVEPASDEEDSGVTRRKAQLAEEEELMNARKILQERRKKQAGGSVAFSSWANPENYKKPEEKQVTPADNDTSGGAKKDKTKIDDLCGDMEAVHLRLQIHKEILPMAIDSEVTPSDLYEIWEKHWGVACASRVRFESLPDSDVKYLARDEVVPCAPTVIKLDAQRGSVLFALATGLKTYGRLSLTNAIADRERRQADLVLNEMKRAEADAKEQDRYRKFETRRRYDERTLG